MKHNCIIVDIDGTLSNCEHRRHHILGDNKHWKAFNDSMGDDTVNAWCRSLVNHMAMTTTVVLVSGRGAEYRRLTEAWLNMNLVRWNVLLMRPEKDYRQDAVVKEEILKRDILPNWDPLFAVDDRKQVVEMWRRNGITCLQCAEGDF